MNKKWISQPSPSFLLVWASAEHFILPGSSSDAIPTPSWFSAGLSVLSCPKAVGRSGMAS